MAEAEKDRVERGKKEEKKREIVRQKRLEQAKATGPAREVRRIIGRLSVLVAPGKKGEIIVRE